MWAAIQTTAALWVLPCCGCSGMVRDTSHSRQSSASHFCALFAASVEQRQVAREQFCAWPLCESILRLERPRRDGYAEEPLTTSAFGRQKNRKIETHRMELSSSATSSCDHVTFQHNVFVFQRTRSCRVIRARIPRRRPCRVVSRSDRLSLAGRTCVLAVGRAP